MFCCINLALHIRPDPVACVWVMHLSWVEVSQRSTIELGNRVLAQVALSRDGSDQPPKAIRDMQLQHMKRVDVVIEVRELACYFCRQSRLRTGSRCSDSLDHDPSGRSRKNWGVLCFGTSCIGFATAGWARPRPRVIVLTKADLVPRAALEDAPYRSLIHAVHHALVLVHLTLRIGNDTLHQRK